MYAYMSLALNKINIANFLKDRKKQRQVLADGNNLAFDIFM